MRDRSKATDIERRFASAVRSARMDLGMTQRELGEEIGYKGATNAMWEIECCRIVPNVEKTLRLIEFLGLDVDAIVGIDYERGA